MINLYWPGSYLMIELQGIREGLLLAKKKNNNNLGLSLSMVEIYRCSISDSIPN